MLVNGVRSQAPIPALATRQTRTFPSLTQAAISYAP